MSIREEIRIDYQKYIQDLSEIERRTRQTFDNNADSIDSQNASFKAQDGSMQNLKDRIENLTKARDKFADPVIIDRYSKKIKELTAEKKKLERQTGSVADETERSNGLLKMGMGLIASYFSVRTVRNIFESARATAEFADEIDKTNERTRLGLDVLQEYRFVTQQLGIDFSALERTIESFTRQIPAIENGTGRSADAFGKLGIDLHDSNGELRSIGELYPALIQALSQMENETERNAIATQLMSERSADLIPLLNAEQGEVDALIKRFREMGVAMDEGAIQKSVEYMEKLGEFEIGMESVRNEFGLLVMEFTEDFNVFPWLQRTMANARDLLQRFGEFRDPLSEVRKDIEQAELVNNNYAESYNEVKKQIEAKLEAGGLNIDQENELREAIEGNAKAHENKMLTLLAEQAGYQQIHLARKNGIESLKESGEWEKLSNFERERTMDLLEAEEMVLESLRRRLDALTGARQENTEENKKSLEVTGETVGDLMRQISVLNKQIQESFDPEDIKRFREEIEVLETRIASMMGDLDPEKAFTFKPAEDMVAALNEVNEEILAIINSVDKPVFEKYFPPGSIGAIQNEIAQLKDEMLIITDEKSIKAYVKRIKELEAELKKLRGDSAEVASEMENIADAASSVLTLAEAFGDVDDNIKSVIRGSIELFRNMSNLQKLGDDASFLQVASPVLGIGAGIASLIGGLIGGNKEEARLQRERMRELEFSLNALRRSVDKNTESFFARDIVGGDVSEKDITSATDLLNSIVGDSLNTEQKYEYQGQYFDDARDIDSYLRATNRNAPESVIRTLLNDILKNNKVDHVPDSEIGRIRDVLDQLGELLPDLFGQSLDIFDNLMEQGFTAQQALIELNLEGIMGTLEEQFGKYGESLQAAITEFEDSLRFGTGDLDEALNQFISKVTSFDGVLPELVAKLKQIAGLDLTTEEGKKQLQTIIAQMFEDRNDLRGEFSPNQFTDLLEFLQRQADGSATGSTSDTGFSRSVQIARSITEIQANEVVALLEAIEYWTRQTAARVGDETALSLDGIPRGEFIGLQIDLPMPVEITNWSDMAIMPQSQPAGHTVSVGSITVHAPAGSDPGGIDYDALTNELADRLRREIDRREF